MARLCSTSRGRATGGRPWSNTGRTDMVSGEVYVGQTRTSLPPTSLPQPSVVDGWEIWEENLETEEEVLSERLLRTPCMWAFLFAAAGGRTWRKATARLSSAASGAEYMFASMDGIFGVGTSNSRLRCWKRSQSGGLPSLPVQLPRLLTDSTGDCCSESRHGEPLTSITKPPHVTLPMSRLFPSTDASDESDDALVDPSETLLITELLCRWRTNSSSSALEKRRPWPIPLDSKDFECDLAFARAAALLSRLESFSSVARMRCEPMLATALPF
mmetsp:Transcript_76497/g.193283  ORF Transcript_76497/g.193283 Transcript_76497/m.193283 type:complete len:272 (+) Transcript_76497:45-860(+)